MRYQLQGDKASALMKFTNRTPEELPEGIIFKNKDVISGQSKYDIEVGDGPIKVNCVASADLGIIHIIDANDISERLAKIKLEGILGFKLN